MDPRLREDDDSNVILDPRLREDDDSNVILDPRLREDDDSNVILGPRLREDDGSGVLSWLCSPSFLRRQESIHSGLARAQSLDFALQVMGPLPAVPALGQ